MNDFTKEELEWMNSRIFYGMEKAEHGSLIYELRKKLQSMIDNYCEHDYQPCLGKIHIDMCRNCLKIK